MHTRTYLEERVLLMESKSILIGIGIGILIGSVIVYKVTTTQTGDLQIQINTLQTQVNSLSADKSNLQDQTTILKAEIAEKENQIADLQSQIEELEKMVRGRTHTTIGGFNVTVLQAQWKRSLDIYDPERKNGLFLLVNLTVKNTAKESHLFGIVGEYFGVIGTAEVAIIDAESYAYSSFDKVPLPDSKVSWTVLPQKLDSKVRKQVIIAFEVSTEAEDLKLGLRTAKDQPWTLLELKSLY